MAEVEDMPEPSVRARQHVVGGGEDAIEWTEQERRVEIALDGAIGADALPRDVERRSPVGADDVAAGITQIAQNRTGADAEMNRRHAEPAFARGSGAAGGDAIENLLRVREDELAIV